MRMPRRVDLDFRSLLPVYRMSLDFMHWTKHVPGIMRFWESIAAQVGHEHGDGQDALWILLVASAQVFL